MEGQFQSEVKTLYSFEPYTLTDEQMKDKAEALDAFWALTKANAPASLGWLRSALARPDQSAFFYYDGAKLLLSLSGDTADKQRALQAIPKADLKSVQHTDYLRTVHNLAAEGLDTREAAFRILAYPTFMATIPQHALSLGQNYALVYMLFPMPEATFVNDLIERLNRETDSTARNSLMLALWYTALPQARSSLAQIAASPNTPEAAKNYAKSLLARKLPASFKTSHEPEIRLREQRRKRMSLPISDEGLIEFDTLTAKLLSKLSPSAQAQ